MATMFELQEQIADLDRTIATERRNGIDMASDAGAKMEDIRACQQRVSDLVERRAILQKKSATAWRRNLVRVLPVKAVRAAQK